MNEEQQFSKLESRLDSIESILNRMIQTVNKMVETMSLSFIAITQNDKILKDSIETMKNSLDESDLEKKKARSLSPTDTPVRAYIYSLQLAKDRFATTPSQKKALDSVIENIKKSEIK
jgi:hypothetical protein